MLAVVQDINENVSHSPRYYKSRCLSLKKQFPLAAKFTLCLQWLTRDNLPVLPALLPGERHEVSLRGYHGDLVDGVQDEDEDALLLEQILPVSEGAQANLALFML